MELLYLLVIMNLIVLAVVTVNWMMWPAIPPGDDGSAATVSVLIPARNEEHNIAEAVRSALRQGDAVGEVLIYDDHSEDHTRNIVLSMQAESEKVRLIEPSALPSGWLGKPFACAQLSKVTRCEWMLFLDADTRLEKGAAMAMLHAVQTYDVTFLSCWPKLISASFWEHVFMPMLNFVVYSIFPTPMQQKDPSPSFGLAHGACLFIHKPTYDQIGGHSTVKHAVFEDTELARIWRLREKKGICLNGKHIVSVRMYTCLSDIIQGFSKIVYPAFRKDRSFWMFMTFHFLFMLLPFLLLATLPFGGPSWIIVGAIIPVLLARLIQCLQFGYPLWSVLFHPIGEAGMIALGLYVRHKCKKNSGIRWKGRTITPS